MKLKRMECPNCGGQVKKEADGKYLCESCGSPFVMDYDADDLPQEPEYASERDFYNRELKWSDYALFAAAVNGES